MKKQALKRRNPMASILKEAAFKPRVVQSKKSKLKHRRKSKHPAKLYGDVLLCT
jgi:stalled ribosome alternative rescue factor ArfA